MNGISGAAWFSRRCEASSGDGAEPVIGPRYARTRWRLLTMRVYGPTGFARGGKVLQSFQADLPGPVLREKRILFSHDANQSYKSRHPGPQEGRIAIVTNVGPGCGGRESAGRVMRIAGRVSRERFRACQTNGAVAYGKTVWSWHPWLVSSRRRFAKLNRAMRAANSPATEARRIRLRGATVLM